MSDKSAIAPKISSATWIGLFLSLFGMLLVRQVVNYVWPTPTFASAVVKEVGMWLTAVVLLVIVRYGEGLPFSSVGLGTARWMKSILWGLLLAVICLAAAGVLVAFTGYTGGAAGEAMGKLPLWLITLIIIRAGAVEELCYRGYVIERLRTLGLPGWLSAAIPLASSLSVTGQVVGRTSSLPWCSAGSWPSSTSGDATWSPT